VTVERLTNSKSKAGPPILARHDFAKKRAGQSVQP
jgi:hypothetical protein